MRFNRKDFFMLLATLLLLELTLTKTAASSHCYVVDHIKYDTTKSRVGKPHWENVCKNGGFVKAVWAEFPTQHFTKWKCCDAGVSIESWSWELRDLTYLSGGTDYANKTWKVECPIFTAVTGFRYIHGNGLKILSAVRCSMLNKRFVNHSTCAVMNFNNAVHTNGSSSNETWQHECPTDYAMVGVYDNNQFRNVHKAKCCRLDTVDFKPGYKTKRFDKSGLSQSKDSGLSFGFIDQGSVGVQLILNKGDPGSFGRLVTPTFQNKPFCVELDAMTFLRDNFTLKLVTATSVTTLYKMDLKKSNKVYVRSNKTITSQLYFDFVPIYQLRIRELRILDGWTCNQTDRCQSNPAIGCGINEVCLPVAGVMTCKCPTEKGFYIDKYEQCVCEPGLSKNSTTNLCDNSTSDIGTKSGVKTTTKRPPLLTTTITKATTEPKSNGDITGEPIKRPKIAEPWVYVLAGLSGGLVLIGLIIAIYLGYKRVITQKKRRRNSFTFHLEEQDRNFQEHCEFSLQTVTTECSTSLYRPYMSSLGSVEYLSTSPRNSILNSSPARYTDDPTTVELKYSRVGLPLNVENRTCVADVDVSKKKHRKYNVEMTQLNESFVTTGTPVYSQINGVVNKIVEDDMAGKDSNGNVLQMDDVDVRRPSCVTLMQPDYGDDSNDGMNREIEQFLIPGDDEEELISDLVELTPESVKISTKILGQGAFGLVKLGEYYSSSSIQKVAVKILKERNNSEITQEDRIIFYQEAAIMSQFDHPNVVTLFGVMVSNKPKMVLEYMARGNLWKYLKKVRRVRQKEGVEEMSRKLHEMFLKMARDILSGMTYLAGLKFVHRDLAARNVLLDSHMNCKIGDFGLSRHFLKDDTYYTSRGGQIPVKWTAPEALQFKRYSTQSDVWSFGIVLWEIWSIGKRPYEGLHNDTVIKEVCENGRRLPAPDQVPVIIYRLMMDCWRENQYQRPTFTQLKFCLDHPDDRLFGGTKKQVERTRSITISHCSDDLSDHESNLIHDPQNYCKTE